MDNRAYKLLTVAVMLASMATVVGCGGGQETAETHKSHNTGVTGLKVYVTDSTCSYAVYGGHYLPPMLRGNCLNPEAQVDVAAWMAIGDNPAKYQCVRLGEANGTAEFHSTGYQYYVIKPLANGPLMVDALKLMGKNVYWWGLWDKYHGSQGAYSSNLAVPESMYGPADGLAASLNLEVCGQANSLSGFIVVPAHSWVEGSWSK